MMNLEIIKSKNEKSIFSYKLLPNSYKLTSYPPNSVLDLAP